MIVLQILGIIFLIVLLIIAYYGFKFYRFITANGLGSSDFVTALSILPPIDIELEPSEKGEWQTTERLEQDETKLIGAGFTHSGYYTVEHSMATIHLSLWQLKQNLVAVIYEAVGGEEGTDGEAPTTYSFEALAMLDDGGSICVSNAEHADLMPRPQKHRMVKIDTVDILELVESIKTNVPQGTKGITIKDAKTLFVELGGHLSEYVWQEEQLRSERVKRVFEPLEVTFDDNLVDQLLQHAKYSVSEVYSERVLKRLAHNPNITAAQWEEMRDHLIVVHEKMDAESISGLLYEMAGDIPEDKESVLEELGDRTELDDPLGVFSEHFASFGLNSRYKTIAKADRPVAALVYRRTHGAA